MKNKGSYQFEKLEGRNHEAAMLARRAQMRLDGFPDLLTRNRFPLKGNILELGTGHGVRARIMADLYPETTVTAIDRSPELLEKAKNEVAIPANLYFENADIYELPFADETFDFVYARLVFMHLSNPDIALKNILRVLKPGGRLLIEDADRDCMFFEPTPASFADFWSRVQQGQRRLGGDPNVGRKLNFLLRQSGFINVDTTVQNIFGNGTDIEFLARTLLPSLNVYLENHDRKLGQQAIDDLLLLSENPLATFYHFWFIVSGIKP